MTSFATRIRPAIQAELDAARAEETRGHFYSAFLRLERAHVLGQSATAQHVRVHWLMLRFALRNGMPAEAAGQLWRLAAAALFTPLGLVPEGNTGGTDVNGLRRMKVPHDLQSTIAAARG